MGYHIAAKRHENAAYISIKDGGTMIEYEDEDPQIRRDFEAKLKTNGVRGQMPEITA